MSIRIALRWVFFSSISEDDSWLRKDKRFGSSACQWCLTGQSGSGNQQTVLCAGPESYKDNQKENLPYKPERQINMYRVPGLYFGVDITGTDKKQISMPKFDSVII